MQSDTAFPEMLHRVSFGVFETGFVGDWVGGCGVDRMWMSIRCCLRVTGRYSSSWVVQNGHDSGCGTSLSSSPEWTALSVLTISITASISGVRSSWAGVIRAKLAWLGELGGGLLVVVELLSGEVGLYSEL